MTTQTESHTRLHGRWLLIARLAWVAVFTLLTVMYALGFLAVREALSTVCVEEHCTLRQQIRHTDAGEKIVRWPGPPIGYADRLRPDQVEVLERLGLTLDQYGWLAALQMGLPVLVFLLIAAGLFWRKSDDWVVLFASIMLATIPVGNGPLPFMVMVRQPAWEWVFDSVSVVALSCFLIFPLIFPTGRFVPRWTRWMALFEIVGAVIIILFPNSILENPRIENLVLFYLLISFGTGVYAQLHRYFRMASTVERQQLKWVIVGLAGFISIAVVVLLPLNALLTSRAAGMDPARALVLSVIPDTIFQAILLFIPVSIAISVLRYRLWDIDLIISRTLVYGALTASIVALYILLVGALSLLSQTTGNLLISLLATGLIAFLFQPLRERLQRGVNRLLYGERDEPYVALSRLGRRLEASLAPEAVLPTVVTSIREVLKLPYVAIYLKVEPPGHKIVAESASPSLRSENGKIIVPGMNREGLCIPLIHRGETLGYIVLGPRAPNEAFSSTDLRLFDNLAPQVGVAAHAFRLTADLERARLRIVAAREEARRRFGSDLHDGVGHQLAGLARRAEMAANLFEREPTAARELLAEVTQQLNAAIAQVRGLAHQLHPPELELLGLAGALRERAQTPSGFVIRIDAPEALPPLPTAVETAAYYIALEALTNVEKHAGARSCHLRLALSNGNSALHPATLELDITDDGRGLSPETAGGLGLLSMQARAAEVGGTCRIESTPQSGTRVSVRLPCPAQLE